MHLWLCDFSLVFDLYKDRFACLCILYTMKEEKDKKTTSMERGIPKFPPWEFVDYNLQTKDYFVTEGIELKHGDEPLNRYNK